MMVKSDLSIDYIDVYLPDKLILIDYVAYELKPYKVASTSLSIKIDSTVKASIISG